MLISDTYKWKHRVNLISPCFSKAVSAWMRRVMGICVRTYRGCAFRETLEERVREHTVVREWMWVEGISLTVWLACRWSISFHECSNICSNPLTSRCHSITASPFTYCPLSTDGVALNNESTMIFFRMKYKIINRRLLKFSTCSSYSWLWQKAYSKWWFINVRNFF